MAKLFSGLVLLCFALSACSPNNVKTENTREGWISPDTYRLQAAGVPQKNDGDIAARRESSLQHAMINARARAADIFISLQNYESRNGDETSKPSDVRAAFSSAIRSGKAVSITYDGDDICDIVFEVTRKNLRRDVEHFTPQAIQQKNTFSSTSGIMGSETCHCAAGMWDSPKSFSVTAIGFSEKGITDREKKRRTSVDSAKSMALTLALHEFTRFRMEHRKDRAAEFTIREALSKKFSHVIHAGRITKVVYDKDDNCEIIYAIQSDNLSAALLSDDLMK